MNMNDTMRERYRTIFGASAVLLPALMMLFTYNAPGTGDFRIWLEWMNLLQQQGLYNTLVYINDNYPPFSLVLLDLATHLASWTGCTPFFWLKASLFAGLALTCALFYAWQRNPGLTLGLFLVLLVNVGCGYLDVYWTASLMAALWALDRRRYAWCGALYTLSIITKPQPLLFAPFLAIHIIEVRAWRDLRHIPWKRVLAASSAACYVLAIFAGALGLAAFAPLVNSLDTTGRHWSGNTTPSGNAMNVNWILTHALHVWMPKKFGPLDHGTANSIGDIGIVGQLPSKLAFAAIFLFVLYRFFRQEKDMATLLLYSATGALTCFMLNTGMHENHLYVVPVVTVALAALDRRYWGFHTAWALAAAMNLLVFYGLGGFGLGYSRVVGADLPLLFSIANTFLYALSLGWMFLHSPVTAPRDAAPPTPQAAQSTMPWRCWNLASPPREPSVTQDHHA